MRGGGGASVIRRPGFFSGARQRPCTVSELRGAANPPSGTAGAATAHKKVHQTTETVCPHRRAESRAQSARNIIHRLQYSQPENDAAAQDSYTPFDVTYFTRHMALKASSAARAHLGRVF